MPKGNISNYINKKTVFLLLLQFILITVILGYRSWKDTSIECMRCHSDKARLEQLGASWAYTTQATVEKESRHTNIECRDCHLGDGRAKTKETAHKGMLKMLIVSESATLLPRSEGYPGPLEETGDHQMFSLLPKVEHEGNLYMLDNVRNILWHDRDKKTFGFDPEIARKTCSQKGCHPEELKQFKHTNMGRNFRQRTMKTWLKPFGPQNCGPSFADLPPPEVLEESDFNYENTDQIRQMMNVPFTRAHAEDKQKLCNVCHAGCLDCHYRPSKENGTHTLTSKPDSLSCSGFGRGASTCHPGAMSSRRGETYIGGDYSLPFGMKPDTHYTKGIHCVDCHPTGKKGMGDLERNATCQDCHFETEESHASSIHKDMDCATCHISQLGGYQITIWGPGHVAGKPNPFKKYSLYYGIQSPPILMRDQKGKWMPVKVWPHSVGNIKAEIPSSPSLQFRWPDGETRDAYYTIGTFDNLPENNKHLLWVEIEQAAHPFGKRRTCESCHNSESQSASSEWEFYDNEGAEEPFTGGHKIIADSTGLRFTDMKNTSEIKPKPGSKLSDFASWVYLKDKWKVPGDFSIKADGKKYNKYKELYASLKKRIERLDSLSEDLDPKQKRQYRALRTAALHNPQEADKILHPILDMPGN